MKVLQINSVYHFGSTGKIVEGLQQYLERSEVSCPVVYGRKENKEYNAKYLNTVSNLISDVTCSLIFDRHGRNSNKNTQKIISYINNEKPDIIHLHNIHGFYVNYELLLSYLSKQKIQVVITMHDCWLFTGFCSHFDYINCEGWKDSCKNCKIRNVYPYRIFMNNAESAFKLKKTCFDKLKNLTLIVPSQWLADQVRNSNLKNKVCKVINNGINLDNFYIDVDTAMKAMVKNKKILLGVSNIWDEKKGLNDYVNLSHLLDENFVIVLIGLNAKQIKLLPNKIIGIQRTESVAELRKWYSSSDYFLNLSYQETFPTVNIEALACGCQILSYKVGGGAEIVGNCGKLFDKYDIKSIANFLNKESKKEQEDKQNQCRSRALELFDEQLMFSKYLNLYDEILSEKYPEE